MKKAHQNELRATSRGFRMNLTLTSERMREYERNPEEDRAFLGKAEALKHAKMI